MRRKKKKLSPQEIESRLHLREIQKIFRNAGIERIKGISGKTFEFDGKKNEIDDVFVSENIIILVEYTSHQSSRDIGGHLQKKKIIFDKIQNKPEEFLLYLENKFPDF